MSETWVELEKNPKFRSASKVKSLGSGKVRLGLKQGNKRTTQSLWFSSLKAFAFYPVSLNSCGYSNNHLNFHVKEFLVFIAENPMY